ncbi:MAG: trimeric intracellular cation channel family protein [Turicibacter sp.]
MDLFTVLEYIGLFVFAASGAICAIEKKMDLFGILTLATVTAIGGGVIRDVVTDVGIPIFFSKYEYMFTIIVSTLIIILIKGKIKWNFSFLVLDAIGLSVFTVAAGLKAIDLDYNFMTFLFVCVITAVGGGVIRDVLAQEVPVILKKEIYASASLLGATTLWILQSFMNIHYSSYIALVLIFVVRCISIRYQMNLPYIEENHLSFKKPLLP